MLKEREIEISDDEIMNSVNNLIVSISEDLRKTVKRYLGSGAIDKSNYIGREMLLSKILLMAALKDEVSNLAIPDYPEVKRDVKNLQYF